MGREPVMVERVRLPMPLSEMQFAVCVLLGLGYNYIQIGHALSIGQGTAKGHADRAAQKIPGDLPSAARCATWVRGAPLSVLTGEPLRLEVRTTGIPGRILDEDLCPLVAGSARRAG